MLEPLLSLAFSLHNNKGTYALLLGSGISRAASVPTGWDVVRDLVKKVAVASGEVADPDPVAWYRKRYSQEPDYGRLLDDLAKTPAERAGLLRGYFEPTAEERERKQKLPTAAHHAIAAMVAGGHFRVIVTTNFDRLLEQALQEVGVAPTVIASPDAAEGALPLAHVRCLILKVHGDYLDTRIKNTPAELEKYDPRIDRLLDQVFDEFGLVIAGWSGDWDPALRAAIERCKTYRFMTYWSTRSPLTGTASALASQRRAQEVTITDADSFFVDLRDKLDALDRIDRPHPISTEIAVERLKRYITDARTIDLHDLVMAEVERVYAHLGPDEFPVQVRPTKDLFLERLHRYEALSDALIALFANGMYWGGSKHAALWTKALERVWNPPGDGGPYDVWRRHRHYPALLLLYASGVAAVGTGDYGALRTLLTEPRLCGDQPPMNAGAALGVVDVMNGKEVQSFVMERRHTPVSDYLFDLLRPRFSSLVPDDARYAEAFRRWEYLYALQRAHADEWFYIGQFGWLENGRGDSVMGPVSEEVARMGVDWPPLKADWFGGTVEGFKKAEARVVSRVRELGWY
jgi:hypothetical protein